MIHSLKTLPKYFDAVARGNKNFEVRKNDRPFTVGDYVALNEYNADSVYTGKCMLLEITYILDEQYYCKDGYVILGLSPCAIRSKSRMFEEVDMCYNGVPVYKRHDNPELLGGAGE